MARKKVRKNIALQSAPLEAKVKRSIGGVFWTLIAILFFLSNQGLAGKIGGDLSGFLFLIFGKGAYLTPLCFLLIAFALFLSKEITFNLYRNLGIILLVSAFSGLLHTRVPLEEAKNIAESGGAGGWIGFTASIFFRLLLGDLATWFILGALLIIGLMISFSVSLKELFAFFFQKAKQATFIVHNGIGNELKNPAIKIIKPDFALKEIVKAEEAAAKQDGKKAKLLTRTEERKTGLKIIKPEPLIVPKEALLEINKNDFANWEFPPLDLLQDASSETFTEDKFLVGNAEKIRQKFLQFGIEVTMKDVHVGPTVTQYTLMPQEGIKLTKITALKDDLALALAAKSLRIEAPIPGKSLVGIELPNTKRTNVFMREMLSCNEFMQIKSTLRLALGRDVSGKPVVVDLAKMPHLLIAGATGAGKSVGLHSFLIALLYQNTPQDLKLILIDPKRVELSVYNSIPHLLTPVITEAEKALSALKWATAEMMRRYTVCSEHKCRNLEEYNQTAETKMPKIVIVIDELADLMMRQYKKETETTICRLAQMARAVGIHLIVATQRPSVDVITGLIKANIPTRISFSVTSAVDSRTVLDTIGAEDLLGMGDMLFLNAALSKPMRIQGIYISNEEVQRVTNRIKITTTEPSYTDITMQETVAPETGASIGEFNFDTDGEDENILKEAVELIKQSGKASASLFQRHLKVGYARAARLLDLLEEKGIVGPADGAKPRQIFLEVKSSGMENEEM